MKTLILAQKDENLTDKMKTQILSEFVGAKLINEFV